MRQLRLNQNKAFIDALKNQGMTYRELGEIYGGNAANVFYWHKERDKRKIPEESKGRRLLISKDLAEILTGLLLGDGSLIINKGSPSGYYSHGEKHHKFLFWLFNLLQEYGLEWSGKIRESKITNYGTTGFSANTYYYRDLKEWRNRFYPAGKKMVPKHIKLTPSMLLHFYIGDGNYYKRTYCDGGMVTFNTQGFLVEDCELLIDAFQAVGINAYLNNSKGPIIRFCKRREIDNFFDYMDCCPKEITLIYGYKFPSD